MISAKQAERLPAATAFMEARKLLQSTITIQCWDGNELDIENNIARIKDAITDIEILFNLVMRTER